jgi:8-oxo-dGTP pyrophosphatase MutT (NUDIX family)
MPTKHDQSFGIIPVRQPRAGELEVLLVAQYQTNGGTFWGFPKGHAEPGESNQAAAVRELHEETGQTVTALAAERPFLQMYSFRHGETTVDKTVTYWIATVSATTTTIDATEISETRWCAHQEARELLTYENTKRILDEVYDYLAGGTHPHLFHRNAEE